MRSYRYMVYDRCGKAIKSFPTYQQASTFLTVCQRYDWSIIKQY